jgi:hypothetical protein
MKSELIAGWRAAFFNAAVAGLELKAFPFKVVSKRNQFCYVSLFPGGLSLKKSAQCSAGKLF